MPGRVWTAEFSEQQTKMRNIGKNKATSEKKDFWLPWAILCPIKTQKNLDANAFDLDANARTALEPPV